MSNGAILEFKEAMSTIKARGIVKTTTLKSNAIYRYDFKTGRFKPYSKEKLYKLFNRLYLNSYDVNYSIEKVFNDLPAIDFNQVENYYKYNDAMQINLDIADLENKAEMYLKLNQENKKEFKTLYWKPQSQLQQLFNSDVFTNGNILCKYKPGGKYFDLIAPKQLSQLFKNVENRANLSAIDIANNYGFFVKNLINIGGLYDEMREYKQKEMILTNYKKDYENIKSLIDGFN